MLALGFSMCREIGENHEAAACIQLRLIESQPWGKQRSRQHPQGSAAGQGRVSGRRTARNQETDTHLSVTFSQWVPAGQKGGGRGGRKAFTPFVARASRGVIYQEPLCAEAVGACQDA